uniref:Secreted protein n=1 Tax=Caenorhabditis tropicalis TaxID=1561998 RepID=A0A1I7UJY2_9PELO
MTVYTISLLLYLHIYNLLTVHAHNYAYSIEKREKRREEKKRRLFKHLFVSFPEEKSPISDDRPEEIRRNFTLSSYIPLPTALSSRNTLLNS